MSGLLWIDSVTVFLNETGGLISFIGQRSQKGHKPALHTGFDHFERFRQDLPVLLEGINPLQAKFLPQKWSFQALNKLVQSPVDYSQCIGQA